MQDNLSWKRWTRYAPVVAVICAGGLLGAILLNHQRVSLTEPTTHQIRSGANNEAQSAETHQRNSHVSIVEDSPSRSFVQTLNQSKRDAQKSDQTGNDDSGPKITDWVQAGSAFISLIVSAALLVVGISSWQVYIKQADIMDATRATTDRSVDQSYVINSAFVSFSHVEFRLRKDMAGNFYVDFKVIIRNFGNSATVNTFIKFNYHTFCSETLEFAEQSVAHYIGMNCLPESPGRIDFRDIIDQGSAFREPPPLDPVKIVLGPQGQWKSEEMTIENSTLEATRDGILRPFVWGWVEYNDRFGGTVRHRTEFCFRMIVNKPAEGTYFGAQPPPYEIDFVPFGDFNGVDEDCHHKGRRT